MVACHVRRERFISMVMKHRMRCESDKLITTFISGTVQEIEDHDEIFIACLDPNNKPQRTAFHFKVFLIDRWPNYANGLLLINPLHTVGDLIRISSSRSSLYLGKCNRHSVICSSSSPEWPSFVYFLSCPPNSRRGDKTSFWMEASTTSEVN